MTKIARVADPPRLKPEQGRAKNAVRYAQPTESQHLVGNQFRGKRSAPPCNAIPPPLNSLCKFEATASDNQRQPAESG